MSVGLPHHADRGCWVSDFLRAYKILLPSISAKGKNCGSRWLQGPCLFPSLRDSGGWPLVPLRLGISWESSWTHSRSYAESLGIPCFRLGGHSLPFSECSLAPSIRTCSWTPELNGLTQTGSTNVEEVCCVLSPGSFSFFIYQSRDYSQVGNSF